MKKLREMESDEGGVEETKRMKIGMATGTKMETRVDGDAKREEEKREAVEGKRV